MGHILFSAARNKTAEAALPAKARKWIWQADFVGSRVTCNPAPLNTDQDILVLSKWKTFHTAMKADGFILGGSSPASLKTNAGASSNFESYTKDALNIIVTADYGFYQRFMVATGLAARLNLLNKDDRIALFQAVLYGNRY